MKVTRFILFYVVCILATLFSLPSCGGGDGDNSDSDADQDSDDDDDDSSGDDDDDNDSDDDDDNASYEITVEIDGDGEVTLSPDKETYSDGDEVSIEAIPDNGAKFVEWSGDLDGSDNPAEVTVKGNMSITAHFAKSYTLEITIQGEGNVTVDPDKEEYESGESVSLEAVPDEGWKFSKWTGGLNSTETSVDLVMNSSKAITAIFIEQVDRSFYSTCVNDGLDPTDRQIMEDQMSNLGYEIVGSNTNVSTSALMTLVQTADLHTLYHTGHGLEGEIMTSNGSLSVNSVSTVDVNSLIVATCLTMVPTTWTSKMASTCDNVFGYTNYSYDGIDNTVCTQFGTQLGNGKSYIQAWYSANAGISELSDRWLGYVREGGSIVEYSARSGNSPAKAGDTFSKESENVAVAGGLLSDTRKFESEFSALTSVDFEVEGSSGPSVDFYRKSPEFLAKTEMTEERARAAAFGWLSKNLPPEARLEVTRPIYAAVDDGEAMIVAYTFRFGRRVNDLQVLTNSEAFHYEVMVNDDEVAASSTWWPEVSGEPKSRPGLLAELIPVNEALENAVEAIDEFAKHSIAIVDVEPCLGLSDGHLVPAYAFVVDDGVRIVVDARTGELTR